MISVAVAAALAGAAVAALWAAEHPQPNRPAGNVAAGSRPAEYPSRQLNEACDRVAEDLRAKLDGTFEVLVRPPFVVAGNMSSEALKGCTEAHVLRPADVMWQSYFHKKPDHAITILLFADGGSYDTWAKRLFHADEKKLPYFGYYQPDQRTIVMNIGTGSGTLVHELTHALIVYDFPDYPDWFNEGLASLHEQCSIDDGEILGAVNWRLPALQEAIAQGKLRPLADLLTVRDFYGDRQGMNYAQARYFCMYLQRQGLLGKFYRQLRDHYDGAADADVRAVEHVTGKKIAQVEKDYLAWVMTLHYQK